MYNKLKLKKVYLKEGHYDSVPLFFAILENDKMSSSVNSQKGFTLIEILITLVILGILVTLATGSFLSYQARAKQSEIKANLGTIGEMAISYKAEFNTYITNWDGLGWISTGKTRYRYWYNQGAAVNTPTSPEAGVSYSDPGSDAQDNSFVVGGVGNIDRDINFTDQWLYNQDRSFTVQQNDVTTN